MQSHARHRHRNHRDAGRHSGGSSSKALLQGQVLLRLLCHSETAGGVIGNSGIIVKQMERETGARILVEDTVPSCHERVINVIGLAAVDRRIAMEHGGVETEQDVSQAQEALMRVYERMLKVEGLGEGVIGCRLLAGPGQVGAIMGKGGKIIDRIRRDSGAIVRVLPKDQLPGCASPNEDLIQTMGGIMSVKKAVIAISCRLQDQSPIISPDKSPYGPSSDLQAKFLTPRCASTSPFSGNSDAQSSIGHSLSAEVEKNLKLNEESGQEVLFRLLCYSSIAGGVIGKAAAIVKALEKETGASIKFGAAAAGSRERIARIYAMEEPEPLSSSAQVAVLRVFARSIEVGINQGLITGETVTARLLVTSEHIHCLIDAQGTLASDIRKASSVQCHVSDFDTVPDFAAENDKVVEIKGAYENVKSALLQITGRLRNNLFSSIVCDRPRSSQRRTNAHGSYQSSGVSSFDQKDPVGSLNSFSQTHSSMLQSPQMSDRKNGAELDVTGGLTSVRRDVLERSGAIAVTDTAEVMIPIQAFRNIYGESGSNLARLKEISGAQVIVQEPSPGKHEGKIIVCGTADQILVAQSLLQAFIIN